MTPRYCALWFASENRDACKAIMQIWMFALVSTRTTIEALQDITKMCYLLLDCKEFRGFVFPWCIVMYSIVLRRGILIICHGQILKNPEHDSDHRNKRKWTWKEITWLSVAVSERKLKWRASEKSMSLFLLVFFILYIG